MISVGIRELKNNLSRYVRQVAAGECIAVTDRGRVVAELLPPGGGDPLAELPVLALPRGTAAALVDEDRDES
jgi:prevent-host-death family protein